MNNEGILACHGYEFEKDPSNYEKNSFIDMEEELLLKDGVTFYGKIVVDLFQGEKLLLQNIKIRLKLVSSETKFLHDFLQSPCFP